MAGKGGFPRPIVYFFVGVILLNLLSSLAEDPGFAEDLPFFLVVGGFILFRIISSSLPFAVSSVSRRWFCSCPLSRRLLNSTGRFA